MSLRVSTTGTDADFVVKLIDVYPTDAVAFETSEDPVDQTGRPWNDHQNGRQVDLRGYQQLVRAEPFRGKYRHSFEHPEPFVPGEPTTVSFTMPDVCHCFCEGHRIMVQVQSSWFPLVDRNPQTFCNIYQCDESAFQSATHCLYETSQLNVQAILASD